MPFEWMSFSVVRWVVLVTVALSARNIMSSLDLVATTATQDERWMDGTELLSKVQHKVSFNAAKNLMDEAGQIGVSKKGQRRRLFLGIWCSEYGNKDEQLRGIIRQTYLKEHQQDITICSLEEIASSCDIVYAFLNPRNAAPKGGKKTKKAEPSSLVFPKDQNAFFGMSSYLTNQTFLYIGDDQMGAEYKDYPPVQFDYVAYTSTSYILHPDKVWPSALFYDKNDKENSIYTMYPRMVFLSTPRGADTQTNETKLADSGGYTMVSSSVIPLLLNDPETWQDVPNHEIQSFIMKILHEEVGQYLTNVDPNAMKSNKMDPSSLQEIAVVHDPDVATKVEKRSRNTLALEMLEEWDHYKDAHLIESYQDPHEVALVNSNIGIERTLCRHGPRMLLGIMSVLDHEMERQRRQVIRETYLSFYRMDTADPSERYRICALHELINKDSPDHSLLLQECQLVYVFVVGGNATGPMERIDANPVEPLTLPSPVEEPDVVVLNIQENMNHGKSQTYLHYAITTVCEKHVYMDYIAKTDSDSVLYIDEFLDQEVNRLLRFPENGRTYGGRFHILTRRSPGFMYYAGPFYFVSSDMARFITSDNCNRTKLQVPIEDTSIGIFAHAYPLAVHRVRVGGGHIEHPFKYPAEYQELWERYIQRKAKTNTSDYP